MDLYGWPCARNDAVHASVSQATVGANLVAAQYAIRLCSQAFNGTTPRPIKKVSAEFDRDAVGCFKGVRQ